MKKGGSSTLDNITYQENLKQQLFRLFPDAKLNGAGTWVRINCPLCNQEGRGDNDYHMYISLGYNGQAPYVYCFKDTNHRFILNSENLAKLTTKTELIDENLFGAISESNKKQFKQNRYKLTKDNKYNILSPNLNTNDYIEVKRLYINKRLGLNLSVEEMIQNKIIFSIQDLLAYNHIATLTRSTKAVELFDQYFVGFLTNTNGFIILRNMVYGKKELPEYANERYTFYTIISNATSGYYTIPTICDIHKHIDIHIAEGTFDILSVFYNLRNANRVNNVYASIGGNSYVNIIKNYFLCGLGIINATFHIYIDNNIEEEIIEDIKFYIGGLHIYKIFIHVNTYPGEKDFGVPKEKINEYIYQISND